MSYARWEASIVDTAGNVQAGAAVEVRSEDTGNLATLFTDIAGTTPLANPFTADAEGFAYFVAAPGLYRIKCGTGSGARTRRYYINPGDIATEDKPLAISAGGTGATTPEAAREALGIFMTGIHNDMTDRDAADAHPADSITNTPAGNIEAEDVQAAINELDNEKPQVTETDVVFAYPSAYATLALVKAAIAKYQFSNGARAIIRIDAGHVVAEQFVFADGDFSHIWIEQAGRTSIRSAAYRWTKIGATNEYFLELAAGGDPSITQPLIVRTAEYPLSGGLPYGVRGALTAGSWVYGASGTGFNTIIIRMADDSDPDTAAAGSITYEGAISIDATSFTTNSYCARDVFITKAAMPLFTFANCASPTIDCMFDGVKATYSNANYHGMVAIKAEVYLTRGSGFQNFKGYSVTGSSSRIIANYCRFTGNDSTAVLLWDCDTTAHYATIDSAVGALTLSGGAADFRYATITAATAWCALGISNASVNLQNSVMTIASAELYCVNSADASTINCGAATATVTSGNGSAFVANFGSVMNCHGATGNESGTGFGFKVVSGGIINANGASGSLSQTKNVITAAGIIFQL